MSLEKNNGLGVLGPFVCEEYRHLKITETWSISVISETSQEVEMHYSVLLALITFKIPFGFLSFSRPSCPFACGIF
jgi:hypothetical protein